MLPGFFFVPSGVKEETHHPDGAGRADCDGRDQQGCLVWKYLLEDIGKDGFAHRQQYPCQNQSRYDSRQADIETAGALAHRFSPASTSSPFSKPCFSKASARLRLSNGSFV